MGCRNLLGLSKHVHPEIGNFSILFHDRVIELYDLFIFVLGRKVTIDILLFLLGQAKLRPRSARVVASSTGSITLVGELQLL